MIHRTMPIVAILISTHPLQAQRPTKSEVRPCGYAHLCIVTPYNDGRTAGMYSIYRARVQMDGEVRKIGYECAKVIGHSKFDGSPEYGDCFSIAHREEEPLECFGAPYGDRLVGSHNAAAHRCLTGRPIRIYVEASIRSPKFEWEKSGDGGSLYQVLETFPDWIPIIDQTWVCTPGDNPNNLGTGAKCRRTR